MASSTKSGNELPMLDEPATGRLTIQYSPDAETNITENPPRFTWLPTIEDGAEYVVRISNDAKYSDGNTQTFEGISLNFFTPDNTLPAGEYVWSYAVWSPDTKQPNSNWSSDRHFTVPADLPETPLPSRKSRYSNSNKAVSYTHLTLPTNREV